MKRGTRKHRRSLLFVQGVNTFTKNPPESIIADSASIERHNLAQRASFRSSIPPSRFIQHLDQTQSLTGSGSGNIASKTYPGGNYACT